jgi:hypothetical protein
MDWHGKICGNWRSLSNKMFSHRRAVVPPIEDREN